MSFILFIFFITEGISGATNTSGIFLLGVKLLIIYIYIYLIKYFIDVYELYVNKKIKRL